MPIQKAKPGYRKTAAGTLPPRVNEYLSKELAAKRIGLSVRRVLELSASGLLKRRTVRDPVTKRRQTVFREEDVDRVVEGNRQLAAYRGGAVGAGEVAALPPVQAISAPLAPPEPRLWLTAEEAANYSGLPASFLLQMIADQHLAALDVGVRPGGRYRIARRDIDAIRGKFQSR